MAFETGMQDLDCTFTHTKGNNVKGDKNTHTCIFFSFISFLCFETSGLQK